MQTLYIKAVLFLLCIPLQLSTSTFNLAQALPTISYAHDRTQTQASREPMIHSLTLPVSQDTWFIAAATPIPVPSHPTLSTFVGNWVSHNGTFTVTSGGNANLALRTYRWCSDPGVKQPCDTLNNGKIVSGIQEKILFTTVTGDTASGKIITSTTGSAGKAITATLQPNDTVAVPGYGMFCGAQAPVGYCGA